MSNCQFKGPFGGIDEQAINDHLEDLVGIDRAFRLMNIARNAIQAASGNSHKLFSYDKVDRKKWFRKKAESENFSKEAINFYIKYFTQW